MNPRTSVWVVVLALVAGCTITLPEPIYSGDVTHGFADVVSRSEALASAQVGHLQDQLDGDAQACGRRLNGHRIAAQHFTGLRVTLTAVGGLVGGIGGVVAVAVSASEQQRAAGLVAAVGGGVALVGTFLSGLIGDPTDRLRRHGQAVQSWDEARRLARRARNEPDLTARLALMGQADDALVRCRSDQAPPDPDPLPLAARGPVVTP